MPQRIQYNGTVHTFPDDFTQQDIAKALKSADMYEANQAAADVPPKEPQTAAAAFDQMKRGAYTPEVSATPLMGSMALAQNLPAIVQGVKTAAASPVVQGGIAGGAEGYLMGDGSHPVKATLKGAIAGAIGGGMWNKLMKAKQLVGAPAAIETALKGGRMVMTPAEIQFQEQLGKVATDQASKVGMAYASGAGTVRDKLLQTLLRLKGGL